MDGVNLVLSAAGAIKARGEEAAVNHWLPTIRDHRDSILAALVGCNDSGETKPPLHPAQAINADSPTDGDAVDAIAWDDDDRRRCVHCLNIRLGGICKVAKPGGLVSAVRDYRPNPVVLHRCAGYRPCPDDPDPRPGLERWPGLNQSIHQNR